MELCSAQNKGLFVRSLSTQILFFVALRFLVLSVTTFCYVDFF